MWKKKKRNRPQHDSGDRWSVAVPAKRLDWPSSMSQRSTHSVRRHRDLGAEVPRLVHPAWRRGVRFLHAGPCHGLCPMGLWTLLVPDSQSVYGLPEYTRIFGEAPTCGAQQARPGRCDTLPRRVSDNASVPWSNSITHPRRDTRSVEWAE